MPKATLPATVTVLPIAPPLRAEIERAVEALISLLDAIDAPSEDLEDDDREHDPAEAGLGDFDGLLWAEGRYRARPRKADRAR